MSILLVAAAKGNLADLKKPWFQCNGGMGKDVKFVNSKTKPKVLWHSICYSAPKKVGGRMPLAAEPT